MTDQAAPVQAGFTPETQSQRWVKYGANVALAIILIVVISALLVYIAQRHDARIDTTSNGVYSLKPQTLTVIKEIPKSPNGGPGITLVSLYTRTNRATAAAAAARASGDDSEPQIANPLDESQTVADLLEEYHRKGINTDLIVIDPVNESDKLAKLHDRLVHDYGNSIKGYQDFLAEWDKRYKQMSQTLTDQSAAIAKLTGASALGGDDGAEIPGLESNVVRYIKTAQLRSLTETHDAVEQERGRKYPDWKAATNAVVDQMTAFGKNAEAIGNLFEKYKDNKQVPEPVRKYMASSAPVYQQLKKDSDEIIDHSRKLGELRVDQLEQALKVENPILVLGPTDWRILSHSQVWPTDTELKNLVNGTLRPRFAGEQQVTAAIYSLINNKKPKLVFIRPGGPPLTTPGIPLFQAPGPFAEIAERMRQYNFDVLEKDLSGQWAMQQRMQQQMPPGPPDPTDEEMKDAVWVVLDAPAGQEGMPPPQIGPKLKDHLDHGGSALVLFFPQADSLKSVMDPWGIELHPEAAGVHQPIQLGAGSPTDNIERVEAQQPFIFFVREYGDHAITRPLKNLESVMVQPLVVRTSERAGYTVRPLIPLDKALPGVPVWGAVQDFEGVLRGEVTPTFHKGTDLAAPIDTGAASEKKGGGRLVVFGNAIFVTQYLRVPDMAASQKARHFVAQFPGNGELAANSFFWLAHLDPMISISPAAMDVSRIDNMSAAALGFWRYGVLLVILPLCVVAAGLFVYMGRRS